MSEEDCVCVCVCVCVYEKQRQREREQEGDQCTSSGKYHVPKNVNIINGSQSGRIKSDLFFKLNM